MIFQLPIGDKEYSFEFTRDAIVQIEQRGINIFNLGAQPITSITGMIFGGLQKHHNVSFNLACKIADQAIQEYETVDLLAFFNTAIEPVFQNGGQPKRKIPKIQKPKVVQLTESDETQSENQ